jgi:nitroreductase
MNALDALLNRVSVSKLMEPAPDQAQQALIFGSALRAADHGRLCPWRFLVIEGAARQALGDLFARAAIEDDPATSPTVIDRFRAMPLRAPMLVVVIARCERHPKVPAVEQLISAGAAAQNMITAAFALGLGAIWRTGDMAYHPSVKQELGLDEPEQIVGYLYFGTPGAPLGSPPAADYRDYFVSWGHG